MKKEKKPKTKTVKQKKVKPQKIKQKKVKAPKYIPVKPVFGTAEDYYIYRLNPVETATGALLGGIVGFFFSMVFFRNVIFSLIVGLLLVVPGIRKYRDYLKDKRMKNLLYQFRDMMESLSASYSAGKNTQGAFLDACGDLIGIYGEKADIVKELKLIVDGIYNGQSVEEMLSNFAARSHLDDIESFATIFEVTNRYGGDMRRVVGETREIINDKIETELEIQTLLTANKNDLNIMIVMPVLIMLMLNGMGNMSIVQNTH